MQKIVLIALASGAVFASSLSETVGDAASSSTVYATFIFLLIIGFLFLHYSSIKTLELLNEDVKINREYKQIRKIQTREYKKKQIEKFKEDQKKTMSEKQKAKSRRNLQKKNRKVLTIEEKKKRLLAFALKKDLRDFHQQEFPNFGNSTYVEYEKKVADIIDQKGKEFLATRSQKSDFHKEFEEAQQRFKVMEDRRNAEWDALPDPTPEQQKEIDDRNNRRIARDFKHTRDSITADESLAILD
jgi:hypothetical protein